MTGDVQHQRDIAQHPGAGTLARHALHGTAEVQVDDIGLCLLHNPGGLDHRVHVAAIDLYGHGTLGLADVQLLLRLADGTYQGIGGHELGVHHICPELLAHQAESGVGDIFHRGEQHGAFPQVYRGNLHI